MPKKEVYLVTESGLEKLKTELKWRKGEEKMRLADLVDEMRSAGDLSENDGYSLAKEAYQVNDQEIVKIQGKIRNAKIVHTNKSNGITLGNTVVVKDDSGNEKTFEVVSESEANPLEGKISHESPIGAALIGKTVGDKTIMTTPRGDAQLTVVSIS